MLCPKALTTSVSRDTTATPTSGQSRTFCIPNTYRGGRWTFQCCCVSEKLSLPQHFALPEKSIHWDWNPHCFVPRNVWHLAPVEHKFRNNILDPKM